MTTFIVYYKFPVNSLDVPIPMKYWHSARSDSVYSHFEAKFLVPANEAAKYKQRLKEDNFNFMCSEPEPVVQYTISRKTNSTWILGPPDLRDGACFGQDVICKCEGWKHEEKAQHIVDLLNKEAKDASSKSQT